MGPPENDERRAPTSPPSVEDPDSRQNSYRHLNAIARRTADVPLGYRCPGCPKMHAVHGCFPGCGVTP
jgi:hypothetical protein